MGVIKRAENLFEIKTTLSEETLYVPSSDEDEHNHSQDDFENHRRQPPRLLKPRPPPVGPAFTNLKNHSGKKKFRRYHNVIQLITLAEEDELNEVTIEDFIVTSKSPFTILLEDDKSFEKWNEFVYIREEKQQELLEAKKAKKRDCERQQPCINKALKSLLRKKSFPIGMLRYLEQQLISFFSAQPTQTYISPVLSSFERLLLHSVSSYHRLASLSFVSEPENVKLVRIKNPRKEFPFPQLLLVQYLESNCRAR